VPHRVLFHDVPCKYCYRSVCPQGHHACLRGVTVDSVVAAVLDVWEETRRLRSETAPASEVAEAAPQPNAISGIDA